MIKVKAILDSLNLFEASGKLDQNIKDKVIATIAELKNFKEKKSKEQTVILKEANDLIDKIKIEQTFSGSEISLKESSFDDNGIISIKVIEAGWGTSGYYSTKVLEEGASIYKPGTLMFWDHPTLTEDYERPERSLRDLAGIIVSEGQFKENGIDGPGVYADARVYKQYRDVIKDMGNDIGISHVAEGVTSYGEADGKSGLIIESLKKAFSVDFVTMPGAGGKIVEKFTEAKSEDDESITLEYLKKNYPKLIESFRKELKNSIYDDKDKDKKAKEAKKMSDEKKLQEALDKQKKEFDKMKESNEKMLKENERFKEAELLKSAKVIVEKEIKDAELPEITKKRLIDSLVKDVMVDEGKIEEDKYKAKIKEAVDLEIKYLSDLNESGAIKNMGSSEGGKVDEEANKKADEKLNESFQRLGMSEKSAKIAAQGR